MTLLFRKEPTTTYSDITHLVDLENDFEVRAEMEDDSGARVVGDITVILSNYNGEAWGLFAEMRSEDRFWIEVHDGGRRKFRGVIQEESVVRDLEEERVTFTAFSVDRVMWDMFKSMRPYFTPRTNVFTGLPEVEYSIERLFAYQLSAVYDEFAELAAARDFGTLGSRTILADPDAPGSYYRLDPSTSFYDVVIAILTQFNAELFIDVETDTLKMVRRGVVINDTAYNLDGLVLRRESGIRSRQLDEKKYDYVYALAQTATSYPPEFLNVAWAIYPYGGGDDPGEPPGLGLDPGHYTYVMTAIVNGIEYQQSAPLDLTLTRPNDQSTRARVDLRILPAIGGTTTRRLWRKSDADPVYRLVNSWETNDLHDTYDIRRSLFDREVLTTKPFYAVGAWYGYNDTDGWLAPVYDTEGGNNRPEGRVLDTIPKLRFVDESGGGLPDDPLYLFYFFNQAITTDIVKEDWVDVMRTRRSMECTVEGTIYKVGDTFITPQGIVPNDFTASDRLIVRRAISNHNPKAQKTRVKLLTV